MAIERLRGTGGPDEWSTLDAVRGATNGDRRACGRRSRDLRDTSGADSSPIAETSGLASAIAETFVATLSVDAPTIGVAIGEGGSGGALAVGATDRLLIQDDAFFSVISPEGAATILHKDASRADEVIDHLGLRAHELLSLGIVDGVLPGPTTAGSEPATDALRERLITALGALDSEPDRCPRRRARYGV